MKLAQISGKKKHCLSMWVNNTHKFCIHIFVKNGIVMTKLILDRFLQTLNDCKSCIIFLYLCWVFILTLPQNECKNNILQSFYYYFFLHGLLMFYIYIFPSNWKSINKQLQM